MGNTDKFEMIANMYDTPERIHIAKVSADAIRSSLAAGSKLKRAIDFGCGTGLVGLNLMDEFQSMLFVDASPGMIDQVRQKISALQLSNADTLCVDLEQETLPELRADCIFMVQVLLHIPDVKMILSRLFDVLHAGGQLLIIDFDHNANVDSEFVHNGFHQSGLKDLLAQIGFRDVQSHTFYTGSKIFMGQDASMFILDARK